MAKAGRGADQYMLRFPPGLRDRIKAAAEDHGRSMNEEIIRTLEKEYPEPWSLDQRFGDLAALMRAFRSVRGHEKAIDAISEEILQTAQGIADGAVPEMDEQSRRKVRRDIDRWRERIILRERARNAERQNASSDRDDASSE